MEKVKLSADRERWRLEDFGCSDQSCKFEADFNDANVWICAVWTNVQTLTAGVKCRQRQTAKFDANEEPCELRTPQVKHPAE